MIIRNWNCKIRLQSNTLFAEKSSLYKSLSMKLSLWINKVVMRGTWGFAVLRCWCFFDAVMRWIKSQFTVLRWSQILRCAMLVFFTLRCSMKWNYLRCCVFLYDWVMRCSLIFFAVLRSSGPSMSPSINHITAFGEPFQQEVVKSTSLKEKIYTLYKNFTRFVRK